MDRTNNLFSKRKKIVLSPHYDDFVLSLGGLAIEFAKLKLDVEDFVIFSNSNYLEMDFIGNKETSKDRINNVSKIRYNEEKMVANKLGNVKIKLLGLDEAKIRGYNSYFVKYFNFYKNEDYEVVKKLNSLFLNLIVKDVDIFVPLGIGKHRDHLIIRDSLTSFIKNNKSNVKAKIYFYEDLPYAGNNLNFKKSIKFIRKNKLIYRDYRINLNKKINLIKIYKSQLNNSFFESVVRRANSLSGFPSERVYFLANKQTINSYF